MFNYIKFFIRYNLRNKTSSGIALLSMTAGFTGILFILLYISFETGYDRYNINRSEIYRVTMSVNSGDEEQYASTSAPVGEYLAAYFPQVEKFVRFGKPDGHVVVNKDGELYNEPDIYSADPDVFSIFSFKMLAGNPETALNRPKSLVVTRSLGRKYFSTENPLGKVLVLNDENYTITGILADLPVNTHLMFQALRSPDRSTDNYELQDWFNFDYYTYILLAPGNNPEKMKAGLMAFTKKYLKEVTDQGVKVKFSRQLLTETHFAKGLIDDQPVENAGVLKLLLGVALFLLVVSSLNYIKYFHGTVIGS